MQTYVVRQLSQAKLLADPFKLRLIEGFAGAPVTTKQVADKMGEKAPRLYRHVEALVDAGLLELIEERPKRGTIERYYKTVAERFEVDPELFSPASGHSDDAMDMVRSLFRDTESDLVRLFGEIGDSKLEKEDTPIVMKFSIRGTKDDIAGLRSKLDEWIEECDSLSGDETAKEGSSSYSGMLAFYRRPGHE